MLLDPALPALVELEMKEPPRLPIPARFLMGREEVSVLDLWKSMPYTMASLEKTMKAYGQAAFKQAYTRFFRNCQPFFDWLDENAHLISAKDLELAYNLVVTLNELGIVHVPRAVVSGVQEDPTAMDRG